MSDSPRTTGPHNVIVAPTRRNAETWARLHYNQTEPHAVLVGPDRGGSNKTWRVYDQAVEVQS